MKRAQSRHGGRGAIRAAAATSAVLGLCLSVLSPVAADETDQPDRAFPSREQVENAEERVAERARDVGAIKASLLLATQQLEQAEIAAARAHEAYNGAMWELQEAKQEARASRRQARETLAEVVEQRRAIGRLIATSYQSGGQLNALDAMMGADGVDGVLDKYTAFRSASTSLQADYARLNASESLARVFEQRAEEAADRQRRMTARARAAKDAATAAAAHAAGTAAQIAAEKDRLIRELARAQDISVELARERQTALEEQARRRAAEQAAAEAAAAAAAERAEEERRAREAREAEEARARAEAQAAEDARAAEREAQREAERERRRDRERGSSRGGDRDEPTPAPPPPAPDPEPQPEPPPPPPPPASNGSAVEQAISYAKAQLGEPYVWGGTGPSTWDCSGLMLRAWESAGVYLPRVSQSQYDATTPISLGQLRRGDLLFWGGPSGVYHVAMYLGDGMMIHAPNSSTVVKIESMYGWPPDSYGRL